LKHRRIRKQNTTISCPFFDVRKVVNDLLLHSICPVQTHVSSSNVENILSRRNGPSADGKICNSIFNLNEQIDIYFPQVLYFFVCNPVSYNPSDPISVYERRPILMDGLD